MPACCSAMSYQSFSRCHTWSWRKGRCLDGARCALFHHEVARACTHHRHADANLLALPRQRHGTRQSFESKPVRLKKRPLARWAWVWCWLLLFQWVTWPNKPTRAQLRQRLPRIIYDLFTTLNAQPWIDSKIILPLTGRLNYFSKIALN